jgi:outer membrane protein OmpA-like peptidoglycan-associated protein
MKRYSAIALLTAVAMLGGCATKKYVAQQVQPVNQKVDQVNSQQQATAKQLEDTDTRLSGTDELAKGADANASKALGQINETNGRVDNMNTQITQINSTLGNLDDYKQAGTATINFKSNSATLTPDATQALDGFVQGHVGSAKRYFVAIEGFTDKVGSSAYNLSLSRRRAEAVQAYLVGQHSIPLFRVQIVGFGKANPVDEGKSRNARAKNRRVEVTFYSADAGTVAAAPAQAPASK